ncbi:MAG: RNA pseudouridine synthase [Oscillatoriales cyanobacterium CG2_30_44_21]|nr:MAG: RNA pseudouridine synthase [Oscillatoriales cyanobacterium CG2_30_44_21]
MNQNSQVNYWYEGRCPFSGELLRLPRTRESEAIAMKLMQELSTSNSAAAPHYQILTAKPEGTKEGKMYGILLATTATGERIVLKAFSGLLNGKSEIAGWVPPIAGRENIALAESITLSKLATIKQKLIELSEIPERLEYVKRSQEYELQLQALREEHQLAKQERQIKRSQNNSDSKLQQELDRESQLEKMARRNLKRDRDQVLLPWQNLIEAANTKMTELKKERCQLSRTLQAQMHETHVLTNFAGETRSLKQLITEGAMPTGMGDCCAPKLLNYAANNRLVPVAMAEFWWGEPSPDGYKIQGEFYGACVQRCQPIMGFLLSGRKCLISNDGVAALRHQTPIVYEDECLIAIAKPSGLLSISGRYLDVQDSALSRLRELYSDENLYPVHRLDRQTSGILLFARNLDTLRHLSQQFQDRKVYKVYEALLSGKIKQTSGVIDLPLWGNPENRPHQQVDWERGKQSVTKFQIIGFENTYPRMEFIPLTGRTHQLRVHAADARGLGMTILGDRLYGCQMATDRLHLHAKALTFTHPRSLQTLSLEVPVPF